MTDKRPSELLHETLQKSAAEVAKWPQWIREAMSSASIFQFSKQNAKEDRTSEVRNDPTNNGS